MSDARQEAVERALQVLEEWRPDYPWPPGDPLIVVSLVVDFCGLLDANNQLRQRLAEAEGLLADFASGGPEDCWLYQLGCQAHDWTFDASGLACPHERLRIGRRGLLGALDGWLRRRPVLDVGQRARVSTSESLVLT